MVVFETISAPSFFSRAIRAIASISALLEIGCDFEEDRRGCIGRGLIARPR